MTANKVTLLDVNGVRHAIDISLFQYSLRVHTSKGLPTNRWSIVFSDRTRIIVTETQANYVHNLRDAYNRGMMQNVMTSRRKRT